MRKMRNNQNTAAYNYIAANVRIRIKINKKSNDVMNGVYVQLPRTPKRQCW
jgi:heme/copper-type cytochrome/quinol oxidase subunit 2